MTALSIQPPYPVFTDTDGQPLEDGYVWIGAANLDPQTNPITVYWDAALTLPAAQPIRTTGGYPANAGTPARLYVASDYSIRIQTKTGSLVFSSADDNGPLFGGTISSVDVTFLQAGTGAVERTAQAKMRDVVSVKDFGAVGNGVADDTTAINLAAATLSQNGTLVFPPGAYVYQSGVSSTSFQNLTNVQIIGYGAKLIQPVEATSGRVVTRKSLYIKDSSFVTVKGFSFKGNHLNLAASDNSFESAVIFDNCSDCIVEDCYAEEFNIAFGASNGSNKITVSNCFAKTIYNAFLAANSSNIIFANCVSDGAHYYPPGATASDKSAGYGFLSDYSTKVIFDSCISIQGGSECFRVQHVPVSKVDVIIDGCKSIQSRRYAISIRGSASYCQVTDCSVDDVGDPSVWNGATYFAPYASDLYGILIDSTGSNNLVSSTSISTLSPAGDGIFVLNAQNNLKIDNCVVKVAALNRGFNANGALNFASITNNTFEVPAGASPNYAIRAVAANNSVIKGNVVSGGYDGILLAGFDNILSENIVSACARYGLNIGTERTIIANNSIKNPGRLTAGAGIFINAANNMLGTNLVTETTPAATLLYALWLNSAATGTTLGPVSEYVSSKGVRIDVALSTAKKPFYTKGVAATDITSLLTSLRDAGLIEP